MEAKIEPNLRTEEEDCPDGDGEQMIKELVKKNAKLKQ